MLKRLKLLRSNKGQATIELAIILPIILLLVMLIIYVGMFVFSKSVTVLSIHQGGREGQFIWHLDLSQDKKEERVRTIIRESLSSLPNGSNSEISVYDDLQGKITITVIYYFKMNLPFLEDITGYDAVPIRNQLVYRYTTK
ncbi:TadE/TadG family type IV pilus assembly protein [Paenibacillus koleovorans]|uniref:TadE/TadG family type IV pilus assembly protein n=1 Tax=Paenibacillus koleovorans TaxID=121608 RepID=UPI000FDBCCB5|nr:TadE/TadG family type IV pilus assembly protein [Paenibacillus koleovorans]